jgi:glutamate formiminotransferase / 5-formyltetrahydrofolate cyclo-ligase
MQKLIHSIPNFSEGIREEVYETILDELRGIKGVELMGYQVDKDFNRTVVMVKGEPEPLKEALLNMSGKAYELIDMELHVGEHPHIGAQDTIPCFPLANITLEEVTQWVDEIGEEIYKRYEIPVYFAGKNARTPEKRSSVFIRKGWYKGLKKVAHLPERAPDLGPAALHPTAGATIVSSGMYGDVCAVNFFLGTTDIKIARKINKMVRGPSGGFPTVFGVGADLKSKNRVAVSVNIFNTEETPIYRVFNMVKSEAARYGIPVTGTEIVSTIRQKALIDCVEYFLGIEDFSLDRIVENHLIGLEGGDVKLLG